MLAEIKSLTIKSNARRYQIMI